MNGWHDLPETGAICQTQELRFWVLFVGIAAAALAQPASAPLPLQTRYQVEWRLFDAGTAQLEFNGQNIARVQLESSGLVGRLYSVKDNYMSVLDTALCTSTVSLQAEEGSRRRETLVTFDKAGKRIQYKERDLIKNQVVLEKQLASPGCVHDVIGGLMRLRTVKLEPGQTMTLPMSDGKKLANAKIEAQEREEIDTPAGRFKVIRYQAHLFDGVLYERKASLFLWLTDDERKLPVQFQVRLRFYIGTITVRLTSPKEVTMHGVPKK